MRKEQQQQLVVLGLDITAWGARNQFIFCFTGLFVCFLLYGIAQEQIMSTWKQQGLHLGWFLTAFQCAFYSASTWMFTSSATAPQGKRRNSLRAFILIGTLSMTTIGLSNTAIEYVSYPVQVAFKSSKPIPVMFAGIFILNKSYSAVEYVAVFCLCFGLYLFTVAENESSTVSSSSFELPQPSIGVAMLCCALVVDGVIGNVQQRTFENVSPAEMIMKTKGVAAIEAFVICALQGQVQVAFAFFMEHPEAMTAVLAYCLCGVVGESFVMSLIKRFGALSAVISTSVRKAFTMVISFFLFARPWTSTYIFASMLVWAGVALHIGGDYYLSKWRTGESKKLEV